LSRALAAHPTTRGPASDAHAALLALTAARLATRVDPDGVAQLLEDQPRDQWDRALIALGMAHLECSAKGEELTVWHLRAEIASLHALAARAGDTDWPRIASLYESLRRFDASPVTELAHAVAIGRAAGAAAGLAVLPEIDGNPYASAARGVFLAELGKREDAASHFKRALALARTTPERRLMEKRLQALSAAR
jgi:RNA polymerase sigma-70 factor (ECF subfamily)